MAVQTPIYTAVVLRRSLGAALELTMGTWGRQRILYPRCHFIDPHPSLVTGFRDRERVVIELLLLIIIIIIIIIMRRVRRRCQ